MNKQKLKSAVSVLSALLISTGVSGSEDPRRSGGDATVFESGVNAFSLPSANMSFKRRLDFSMGNSFFRNPWVPAPASTEARDGLGPLFNINTCQGCHIKDGRGHPPEEGSFNAVSMLFRLSIPVHEGVSPMTLKTEGAIAEPTYGGQLQDFSIPGLKPEGQIKVKYTSKMVKISAWESIELRKPEYSITDLNYGPMHPETMISPRIASPMIGLGLLEALTNEQILSNEDPNDRDGDGISGRANRVWDKKKKMTVLGRFGWKAGQPTLEQQNAGAFAGDMGLTTNLFPADDCTKKQQECKRLPNGGTPEVSDEILNQVTIYSRNLAVPARRDVNDPKVIRGEKLFESTGCAACHTPTWVTQKSEELPEQSNQKISPYTDLLLHDMGEDLADNRPDFIATGREWRTPPLWGIGLTKVVNPKAGFLHDGRARDLTEAILWHGGEGQASRDEFLELKSHDRLALVKFLESL